MKNKSSKIISIGSIGDLCVNTHKSLDLPRQWNVGLIPIPRQSPNFKFHSQSMEQQSK